LWINCRQRRKEFLTLCGEDAVSERRAGSDKARNASSGTMPSPSADVMDTSSQYSSCETLDSHRSSEADERSEVNGNDGQRPSRKVRKLLRFFAFDCFALFVPVLVSLSRQADFRRAHRLHSEGANNARRTTKARLQSHAVCGDQAEQFVPKRSRAAQEGRRDSQDQGSRPQRGARRLAKRKFKNARRSRAHVNK
jgi:hypothetical protein